MRLASDGCTGAEVSETVLEPPCGAQAGLSAVDTQQDRVRIVRRNHALLARFEASCLLGRSTAILNVMAAPPELIPLSLEPTPVIEAYKVDVDCTLLRENLKLTPDERLRKMMAALALVEEVRRSQSDKP